MNAVIAELVLFAKRRGEEPFKVTVQIGTPYKSLDDPEEWACPVVVGPLYKHLPDVYGTDSMQALCLAVSLVLKSLQAFRDDGGTLSFDGSGDDFPLEAYSFRPEETRLKKQKEQLGAHHGF